MFEVAVLPVHRKQRDERFLAQQRVRQLVCQLGRIATDAVHLEPEFWVVEARRPPVCEMRYNAGGKNKKACMGTRGGLSLKMDTC